MANCQKAGLFQFALLFAAFVIRYNLFRIILDSGMHNAKHYNLEISEVDCADVRKLDGAPRVFPE